MRATPSVTTTAMLRSALRPAARLARPAVAPRAAAVRFASTTDAAADQPPHEHHSPAAKPPPPPPGVEVDPSRVYPDGPVDTETMTLDETGRIYGQHRRLGLGHSSSWTVRGAPATRLAEGEADLRCSPV